MGILEESSQIAANFSFFFLFSSSVSNLCEILKNCNKSLGAEQGLQRRDGNTLIFWTLSTV